MSKNNYWIWEIKIGKKKILQKTFMTPKANPCHKAVSLVKKHIKGDEFYLEDGRIVRHKIDTVGYWKVKRFENGKQVSLRDT